MKELTHEFRVSAKELEYLLQIALRDESLAGLIRPQDLTRGRGATLRLSRTAAEQLRDRLMNEMDVVGFDESYIPNEQGRIIEALIDRFFVR